ncbi:MAG: sensor histidine kinase [Ferrimicrobium sp.]|jgi:signal transduction histidine kinase|nr:sensor histidine kinase [Ferrimicrobium sp.]
MNTLTSLRQSKFWPIPIGTAFVALLTVIGAYVEAYPHNHYGGLHLSTHPGLVAFALPLASALAILFVRKYSIAVFIFTILAAMGWSALGQLNGAMLVPILVALFWMAKSTSWHRAIPIGILGAIALWVANGALGPFGWIGGPGLTMWPEMITAFALGNVASARQLWHLEARGRQADAERAREEEVRGIINEERMRIARELHDVVAHTMAMINIQASAAQLLLTSDPQRASQAIGEIHAASKSALQELRSILAIMRPPGHEDDHSAIVPDLSAIQGLVEKVNALGMETTLRIQGDPVEPPAAVALASFRIVQEALTNVARHASDAATTVELTYAPEALTIQIDNTAGDATAAFQQGSGSGLIGMQERVRSLAGFFSASSLEGGGFRVRVVLPLSQEATRPEPGTQTSAPRSSSTTSGQHR